jgi:hypothetical protein
MNMKRLIRTQNPATVFAALLMGSLFLFSCKDPYNVKVQNAQKSVLVVEGFLSSGGPTTIKLSRSFPLSENARLTMEGGAQVFVEAGNTQYPLTETTMGNYSADLGVLDASKQYRLHIKTGGKEYLSDAVAVQSTPPIDSINWRRDAKGVTIYANTHDATNNSRYYRYDYIETWENRANYIARWLYDPSVPEVRRRRPDEMIYQCWTTVPSSNINLVTSTALQNDVIFEKPLVFIPNADQKLSVRYSILVKQYVLSKEAYEFFQLMKKNTESLGTIFDPQPSQLTGNIHSLSDKDEPVIGFFYASSEQQKRIFIDASQVPDWGFGYHCGYLKIPPILDTVKFYAYNGLIVYDADESGFTIADFRISDRQCFDCTISGGVTTKPSFW